MRRQTRSALDLPLLSCLTGRKYATEVRTGTDIHAYCKDIVRSSDYGNYLVGLRMPEGTREGFNAIRAFNVEIAKVKDTTSEVTMGMIRMKWWQEAIDECYKGTPRKHPIVEALAEAINKHKLSRTWFKRIIEKRAEDLETRTVRTVDDLEAYADHTASSLISLSLEMLGVKDLQADHAASHVGRAVGIVTLLRATPHIIPQRQIYLPYELLAKHKISQEDLLRGVIPPALAEVAYDVASIAHLHLEKARSMRGSIPKNASPALLPAVIAEDYLKRLQANKFDLFDSSLSVIGDFSFQWQLWKRSWTKAF